MHHIASLYEKFAKRIQGNSRIQYTNLENKRRYKWCCFHFAFLFRNFLTKATLQKVNYLLLLFYKTQ